MKLWRAVLSTISQLLVRTLDMVSNILTAVSSVSAARLGFQGRYMISSQGVVLLGFIISPGRTPCPEECVVNPRSRFSFPSSYVNVMIKFGVQIHAKHKKNEPIRRSTIYPPWMPHRHRNLILKIIRKALFPRVRRPKRYLVSFERPQSPAYPSQCAMLIRQ